MNNKILFLPALALPLLLSSYKRDGECKPYYPIKLGTAYEIKNYSDKDKLTGSSKGSIQSVNTSGDTLVLAMTSTAYDDKDKQLSTVNFTAKCAGGVLLINMSNMADPKQTKGNGNTSATIKGDFLDLPSNPTAGQQLKGGTLTISMGGSGAPGLMNINTIVDNRKVEGMESVTTPAGTFNCVKISFDVSTKMIFNVKSHVIEWYALNVGMVRSERYNDKGKLQGYSELSSISGN